MSEGGGGFSAAEFAQSQIENLKLQEERLKKEKEIASASKDYLGVMQKQLEIERFRNSELIATLETLKKNEKALEDMLQNGESLTDLVGQLKDNFKMSSDQADELQKKLAKGGKEAKNALQELIETQREYRAQQDISKQFAEDIERTTSSMAQKMGIASKFSKTTAGGLFEMAKAFKEGDPEKNMLALVSGFKNLFNPLNIAASLLDMMINKVFELNKAAIELNIATGYANDFQTEMTNLTAETIKFGVSMKDSNGALSSVVKTVSGINLRSKEFRDELSKSAALMTKLGISTETTAKNQQFLDKTFGMSGPQITATLEDIAMSAEAIGISAQEISSNFVEAMGYLTSFGKEGVRIFKEIQLEASRSGIAVSNLMKLTQTFDEFSAGASKAAEINAVLGTSLSSIALMSMTPEQRLKELTNQLRNATGGVDSMTHAQKLFLSNSLGMNIAEMTALLGEETEEMARAREAKEKQAEIEERLANAAMELLPFMDRMSMAFEKLASNKRLMNGLALAIELTIGAIVLLVDNIEALIIIGAGYLMMVKGITAGKILMAFWTGTLAGISATYHGVLAVWNAVASVTIMRTALMSAGMKVLAFFTNMSLGKFLMLAGVFYLLYNIFSKRINPIFIQFGFFLAAGIIAMGVAAQIGGFKLIGLVLAFALALGMVALIIYAIKELIVALTGFFTLMIENVTTIPLLAAYMYLLGTAFLFLGASALMGSLGLFVGIGALSVMLALFKLTGTSMKDMFGAGDEILKIGNGILNLGNGLTALKSAISEIKSTIGADGLFAASIEGGSSSIVMGEGVHVAKLFKNNKVTVDVKMPKISMPEINVIVKIGETELQDIVDKYVENRTGVVG